MKSDTVGSPGLWESGCGPAYPAVAVDGPYVRVFAESRGETMPRGPWLWTLLAVVACGTPADDKDAETGAPDDSAAPLPDYREWTPDSAGPFRAGHTVVEVTYSPSSGEGSRSIPVHAWYPTASTEGEEVVHEGIFPDAEALGEAMAARASHEGGHPVLIHSHGSQGYAGNSAFLHAHFASHGWVVLVPDHLGNTLTDNDDPRTTAHYIHRPEDLSAALDAASSGAFSAVGLSDLSVDRVVASGHSFGVYTMWAIAGGTFDPALVEAACAGGGALGPDCTETEKAAFAAGLGDERVIATIPMAGSIKRDIFGDSGHASVDTPMLAMSGTNDPVGAESQFEDSPEVPLTWIDIEGACHQTFGLGTCDTLDTEEGFVLVESYALSFARVHLLGDDSAEAVGRVDGTLTDERVAWRSHVYGD